MGLLTLAPLFLVVWVQPGEAPGRPTLGLVYEIAERDALEEIEDRAAGATVTLEDFGDSDGWSATRGMRLPLATRNALRMVTPIHRMRFAIPDPDGVPIYPDGYMFNPLDYAVLPGRLIVTPPDRLDWARAEAKRADMILLSGGNALKTTLIRGERIFVLREELAARLGLEAVPAIIEQVGAQLKIAEFDAAAIPLDRPAPVGRGPDTEPGTGPDTGPPAPAAMPAERRRAAPDEGRVR